MNNSIIYTPYVYHICWSKTNIHYIGVEYKQTAHPENLWTKYFTSSEYVKAYRDENGEPDIIEVRKTFNTAEEALCYEHKMLTKTGAARSELFLNKCNGYGAFANYGPHSTETRQKLSESHKGKTHSTKTRKKMSESRKGKTHSTETRQKLSESHKGKTHSTETRQRLSEANKGKTLSAETRKKMSEAKKGKTLSAETRKKMSESRKGKTRSAETRKKISEAKKGKVSICPHCNKEGSGTAMKQWHFDNCKLFKQ